MVVSSIIQKLRTRARLVPFLILFLLKALCSLVVLNFYMATHISTVMQQQYNKIDSSFSMMYPKGGYIVDDTTRNNTQDTKNSKIPNTQTPTNDIENERMITPNLLDGTLQGKERLWSILQTRNITQVNANYWASVPSWDTILRNIHQHSEKDENIGADATPTTPTLPSPIILGLDTCNTFQERTSINPSQRRIAPAGLQYSTPAPTI